MVPRWGWMRGRDCLKHTDRGPHQLPCWPQWSYSHASKPWRCLGWDSKRCPAESLAMEDSPVPLEKTVSQRSSTGLCSLTQAWSGRGTLPARSHRELQQRIFMGCNHQAGGHAILHRAVQGSVPFLCRRGEGWAASTSPLLKVCTAFLHSWAGPAPQREMFFFFLFLIQFSNGAASLFWIEFISLD